MTEPRRPSIRLHGASFGYADRRVVSPASTSSCTRARSWPCSAPTGRASPRWCAASSA